MGMKKKAIDWGKKPLPANSTIFFTMSTLPVSLLSLPVATHHIAATTSALHTIHSDPKSTLNVISSSAIWICPSWSHVHPTYYQLQRTILGPHPLEGLDTAETHSFKILKVGKWSRVSHSTSFFSHLFFFACISFKIWYYSDFWALVSSNRKMYWYFLLAFRI